MQQSTRLIVNTLSTYVRMVLTVGLGLLTTRVVYAQLGETDFGLQAVVGAGGSLLLIFSDAPSSAVLSGTSLFTLASKIRNNFGSFSIRACCFSVSRASLMATIGWACGPVLLHSLQIPAGRQQAASLAFALDDRRACDHVCDDAFPSRFYRPSIDRRCEPARWLRLTPIFGGSTSPDDSPGDRLVVHSLLASAATVIVMGGLRRAVHADLSPRFGRRLRPRPRWRPPAA